MAGTTAAAFLKEKYDMSVLLLEGKDRLGGRTWTADLPPPAVVVPPREVFPPETGRITTHFLREEDLLKDELGLTPRSTDPVKSSSTDPRKKGDVLSVDLGANYIHGASERQPVLAFANAINKELGANAIKVLQGGQEGDRRRPDETVLVGEVWAEFWEELRTASWFRKGGGGRIPTVKVCAASLVTELVPCLMSGVFRKDVPEALTFDAALQKTKRKAFKMLKLGAERPKKSKKPAERPEEKSAAAGVEEKNVNSSAAALPKNSSEENTSSSVSCDKVKRLSG